MNSALLHRRWSTLHLAAACLASASLGYVLVRDRSRDFREANPSTAASRLANPVQPAAASTQPESAASSAASPSSSVPAAPSVDTIAVTWRQLSQIERTPASERAMADFIEQLALADSARALALANAEPNWRTRRDLTHAVLRGWATGSARAAAEWAGTLPEAERSLALQAVFAGAAQRPNDAIRVARELSAANPQMAGDYGQWLITGLSEAGEFEAAANFAAADVSEHRAGWLHATFYEWAAHQPEAARAAIDSIEDAARRHEARGGLLAGWAVADPAALARHAMALSQPAERAEALNHALPQWVIRDPVAAAEWLLRYDPLPELDAGAEAAALSPELVQDRPETAFRWAASIADPTLRANTLHLLATEWAQRDREAVRRFLASTPNLPETDRSALLDGLAPAPDT